MSDAPLFSPFRIGAVELPNRVVMAPMTRSRAGAGAVPSEYAAQYYSQRASAGLIVTEAIGVSAQALGYPRTPGLYTDAQQAGWRGVVDAVHQAGGRIAAQLWHVGRIFARANNPQGLAPLAPSAVAAEGRIFTENGLEELPVPRAMTIDELRVSVESFGLAASRAFAAGFDLVELHAANGYLIEQFMSDQANRREDAFGGSLENRLRFLDEVLEAVSRHCGGLGRVGVRLSPFGEFNGLRHGDPGAVFRGAMAILARRQVGYVHLIEPEVSGDRDDRSGKAQDIPDVLAIAREYYQGPLITAGGYDRSRAESVLRSRKADLIGFGRPYISNPDLVERLYANAPLAEWNRRSFYTPGPEGYVDYPALAGSSARATP